MIWGFTPPVVAPEVGAPDMWSNPALLKEELGIEGFLPTVWHCARGRVCGDGDSAFPTSFKVGIFWVSWCAGVTELVSVFLSEGIASCGTVHLVHLCEDVTSRARHVAILIAPFTIYCTAGLLKTIYISENVFILFLWWTNMSFPPSPPRPNPNLIVCTVPPTFRANPWKGAENTTPK